MSPSPRRGPLATENPLPGFEGRACGASTDVQLLRALFAGARGCPDRLAGPLVRRFGSLAGVLGADAPELARAGAEAGHLAFLALLRETLLGAAREDASRRPVVSSWSQLLGYVRTAMAHKSREQFRVLYLDKRNLLLGDEWVAEGTVDHAPVYPREVVRRALELSASALILVHNHPSGDPTPSQADIAMTRKVVEAARALDLQVHDHVVVGRDGTASFRALGLM